MKRLMIVLLSIALLCGGSAFACKKHIEKKLNEDLPYTGEPNNPAWTACEHVTDCAIIQTSCLGPVTVNKEQEAAYRESLKDQPTIQCVRFVDPKEVCVACEEKQCKIKSYKEDFNK